MPVCWLGSWIPINSNKHTTSYPQTSHVGPGESGSCIFHPKIDRQRFLGFELPLCNLPLGKFLPGDLIMISLVLVSWPGLVRLWLQRLQLWHHVVLVSGVDIMDMANPYVPCVLFSDWRSQQEGGIYTNADVGPACACACASERPSTVPCVLYMHFWNSLSLSLPDFVLLLVYFNYSQGTRRWGRNRECI